ncbi:hypothetical protein LXL04_031572 [Taraxacum kok-saghyz]
MNTRAPFSNGAIEHHGVIDPLNIAINVRIVFHIVFLEAIFPVTRRFCNFIGIELIPSVDVNCPSSFGCNITYTHGSPSVERPMEEMVVEMDGDESEKWVVMGWMVVAAWLRHGVELRYEMGMVVVVVERNVIELLLEMLKRVVTLFLRILKMNEVAKVVEVVAALVVQLMVQLVVLVVQAVVQVV